MTDQQPLDSDLLRRAAAIIKHGGLVAYPTDTVYGLAALPADREAMARLIEAKKRDPEQPVPLLIADAAQAAALAADPPEDARRLMAEFWPGALTIVLRKAPTFDSTAVGETVGLRVPDHPVPRELARLIGGPITGTSANIAGGPEPLSADDVRSQLGDAVELVIDIDGGRCPGGRPSTVIDCTTDPPRIVRQGAVEAGEIERVLGKELG